MGDRVDALESQIGEMRVTLKTLADQMQQQTGVLNELSKLLGKKTTEMPTSSEASVGIEIQGDQIQGDSRL
ncbi:hypothetical protein A2U01_0073812, partial [Trifolium medium]|nr:hypothetical protein [Trifolium medium]